MVLDYSIPRNKKIFLKKSIYTYIYNSVLFAYLYLFLFLYHALTRYVLFCAFGQRVIYISVHTRVFRMSFYLQKKDM